MDCFTNRLIYSEVRVGLFVLCYSDNGAGRESVSPPL